MKEKELELLEVVKCETCGNNEGTSELHTCPYAEDINGDSESMCNCCSDCEYECCMDI
jgi:hypothetical protein